MKMKLSKDKDKISVMKYFTVKPSLRDASYESEQLTEPGQPVRALPCNDVTLMPDKISVQLCTAPLSSGHNISVHLDTSSSEMPREI